MTESLISVIVPTYNRSAFLRNAVDSVRRQTYRRWELIVIDDGSTDDTPATLATLDDPRLRLIPLEHTGNPARVRNAGLAVARGEYVAFLDDDDLWLPDKLATQLTGLARTGCRWGYTAFRRIDATGQGANDTGVLPWRPHRGWILEALLRIEAVVPLPTVMVERTLLAEVGGFDEAFLDCEDYELWFRLAACSVAHVEEAALACVRVHPQHRQANRERVHASWVAVYEKTARTVRDDRLTALCLRRRAEHQVFLARLLVERGRRGSSLALLARSARRAGGSRAWWKALARSLLPDPAVSVLRAIRRSRPGSRRTEEARNATTSQPR